MDRSSEDSGNEASENASILDAAVQQAHNLSTHLHRMAQEDAFAERIFSADGRLDWSEFMALEMLRLGKVEMGTLEAIKREFDRLDADGNGSLSLSEVQAAREGAASPSALVQE